MIGMESAWPIEGCQAIAAADSSPSPGLRRKGSFALPGMLTGKTADEVWNFIQRNNSCERPQHGQLLFGEMTLQDFLVRAGVVSDDEDAHASATGCSQSIGVDAIQSAQNLQNVAQWRQFQFQAAQEQHQQQPLQELNFLQQESPYAADTANQAAQQSALAIIGNEPTGGLALDGAGNTLSFRSCALGNSLDSPSRGKKRAPEIILEKTVERRQKRMIKNRESAARSRARRQAYTNELENEVTQLMEENAKLKQQQCSQNLLPAVQPQQPKHALRRNKTAPF